MRSKKLLLSLVFAAIAGSVQAQNEIGIAPEVGGVYYVNISLKPSEFSNGTGVGVTSTGAGFGGRLGAAVDFGLGTHVSFQPALYFSYDRYTNDIGGLLSAFGFAKFDVSQYDLLIPLNIQFRFKGFFFGAGPSIGYTLGGNIKETYSVTSGTTTLSKDTSYSLKTGTDSSSWTKPLSVGLGVNAGYKLPSGLFFRIQYQYDLMNTAPISGDIMHGYSACFSIGYFLGGGGSGGSGGRGSYYRFQRHRERKNTSIR